MQATSRKSSMDRWEKILIGTNVKCNISPLGAKIEINGPNRTTITINHNADAHWTIRIPGTSNDGMRFAFGADVVIDQQAALIIINGILAIRYQP